jgi:hypothetical protein
VSLFVLFLFKAADEAAIEQYLGDILIHPGKKYIDTFEMHPIAIPYPRDHVRDWICHPHN